MKIEIGESLMYSWLRHVEKCELVQTNWKSSPSWTIQNTTDLQTLMDEVDDLFKNKWNYFLFKNGKKTATLKSVMKQVEIDVIGMHWSGLVEKLFTVDVAFHESGVGYKQPVEKILAKCVRAAMCAYSYWNKKEAEIIFAAPKIHNKDMALLKQCIKDLQSCTNSLGYSFNFKLIVNEDFFTQVLDPVVSICDKIADTNELFVRSCKMLAMQYTITSKTTKTATPLIAQNQRRTPNRHRAMLSVNGKQCRYYYQVIEEAMKIYVTNNPQLTAIEIVNNWDPVKVVSNQVETDVVHQAQRIVHLPNDSRYDSRSKEIKLPQGGSVFVSTEFTGAEARELANMINQQHWGITIN